MQRNQVGFYITPYTKVQNKTKTYKNKNYKTVRGKLYDIHSGNDLLDLMPKAQAIKLEIGKLGHINIKLMY